MSEIRGKKSRFQFLKLDENVLFQAIFENIILERRPTAASYDMDKNFLKIVNFFHKTKKKMR